MSDYYILITDAGVALEAAAHASGQPVVLTAFGACDGGAAFTPDPTLTALANEEYRGDISSLAVSEDDPTVLVAQCIIPASSGGYTIRGIGIYAGDTLYAVGNYPDQPKPAPDTGYAASLEILAQLAVSDTADVTLNVTDGAWLTKEEGDQLYVPLQRKINGHDLTADLTLTPADVDAVPSGRTVNGHPLTADVMVTPQDIFTNPIALVEGWDLNGLLTPGLYVQEFNAGAANSANYPVALAGTLIITKNAGVSQVYIEYATGTTYVRSYYGESWSAWRRLAFSDNETFTGNLTVSGAVFSKAADSFRLVNEKYGAFWRNDGVHMYLMLTNAGDPYGAYNNFRPFIVDLATGAVTLPGGTSANGLFYADELNVGAARLTNDGNVFGSMWGNDWLSNYINSRLAKNPNVVGVGGVGTYAFCSYKYASIAPNQLVSGSDLFISGVGAQKSSSGWGDKSIIIDQSGTLSGTWMCCGAQPGPNGNDIGATLYYRIA